MNLLSKNENGINANDTSSFLDPFAPNLVRPTSLLSKLVPVIWVELPLKNSKN